MSGITQYPRGITTTREVDVSGNSPLSTVFGEGVVGFRTDDIDVLFQYNNSTRDVTASTTGGGGTANTSSMGEVNLDTATGTATLTSVASLRYRPGHEAFAFFTGLFSGAQSGVNHYIGLNNGSNGVCFGTKDGDFGIWFITGGSETFVAQADWNGTPLPADFTIDITKLNLFNVRFGWLGIAPIAYSIYAGRRHGWVTVHYHDVVNTQATPTLGNPTLPISAKITRASGTGTAAYLRTASWNGHVIGGTEEATHSDRWFAYAVLDTSPADLTARNHIFTIKNASTFQGKTNHVPIELAIVSFDNSTTKTVAFYGVKNATLTGASAYSDIDATNSIASISTGGTLTGTRGPVITLQKDNSTRVDVRKTGIIIYPGETFSFEALTASAATGSVSVSARWFEKF